jgi:hypothetical protein
MQGRPTKQLNSNVGSMKYGSKLQQKRRQGNITWRFLRGMPLPVDWGILWARASESPRQSKQKHSLPSEHSIVLAAVSPIQPLSCKAKIKSENSPPKPALAYYKAPPRSQNLGTQILRPVGCRPLGCLRGGVKWRLGLGRGRSPVTPATTPGPGPVLGLTTTAGLSSLGSCLMGREVAVEASLSGRACTHTIPDSDQSLWNAHFLSACCPLGGQKGRVRKFLGNQACMPMGLHNMRENLHTTPRMPRSKPAVERMRPKPKQS